MIGARVVSAVALTTLVVSCSSSAPNNTSTSAPPPTSSSAPSSASSSLSSSPASSSPSQTGGTGVPRFEHVVVVVEENHGFLQIAGATDAPYIHSLISSGVLVTHSLAVSHPSEPNYVALFSGSTHGLSSDACPVTYAGPDLASALAARGATFTGYAEDLPSSGSEACSSGSYARKHAPWTDFSDVPKSDSQPMTAFPTDFAQLPSVAFVVPNLDDDMHDGTISQGDTWLQQHLAAYVTWASSHDSLLILTFDEDEYSEGNRIVTVLAGAHVKRGATDSEQIDHYSVLRTLEDVFGTAHLGASADRAPILDAWA